VTGIPGDPGRTAIGFTTTQEFHRVAGPAAYDLGDVFTLERWIKRNNATAANYGIVGKGATAYYMRLSSDNKIHLLKDGTADISGSTATITDTTTWHYVACTKNGASTVTIEIDGVEGHSAPTADVCVNAGGDFLIGADAPGTSDRADLTTAHIAGYPTVLSHATLLSHYQTGITAPTAILPQWCRIRYNG